MVSSKRMAAWRCMETENAGVVDEMDISVVDDVLLAVVKTVDVADVVDVVVLRTELGKGSIEQHAQLHYLSHHQHPIDLK